MDEQQRSATNYSNWANANAIARQAPQTDPSAGAQAHEAAGGKVRLSSDLQAAKDAGRTASAQQANNRDTPTPDAAKQEKPSGKAALAEDLKAAKESAKETDQSRDPGRSR
jgi:hypothetical protein